MSFGARALIRLGALKHNLKQLRALDPDAKVMAVIKANAYGHGMVAVAQTLSDVDAFAVARVPEALELRANGIETDIVLLSGVLDDEEFRAAVNGNFQQVVHCKEQLELLRGQATGSITCWLKLDTGMHRLGFPPADAAELLSDLRAMPAVSDVRLMTHLSSADELNNDRTDVQLRRFVDAIDQRIQHASICNSAGMLGWPQIRQQVRSGHCTNWVRPGIALFGISPFDKQSAAELGLKPVMQFEARLIASKPLAKGEAVGYKEAYSSDADTMLGLISAGYGDGYSRHFRSGTPILINGRKVPLIGIVSMDMIAVDLGPGANDQVGDIATLWGKGLPVEEVAPWANAIPYELVCGVMNREASEIVD